MRLTAVLLACAAGADALQPGLRATHKDATLVRANAAIIRLPAVLMQDQLPVDEVPSDPEASPDEVPPQSSLERELARPGATEFYAQVALLTAGLLVFLGATNYFLTDDFWLTPPSL
jgi:hypothetical protein